MRSLYYFYILILWQMLYNEVHLCKLLTSVINLPVKIINLAVIVINVCVKMWTQNLLAEFNHL